MSANHKSTFASLPKTTRGAPIVIGGDPKEENFLYTNGNSVFIRGLENPADCDVYTQHSQPVLCAKYSPSRFYIASGDQSGKVRIWDTVNKEHILKKEYPVFAGPIKDLEFTADSTKIAVGGAGKEKFTHVINADTGTSVGDMIGHSKAVNSLAVKPTRPFRIASGGEDYAVVFFQGPPFKFDKTINEHTNFVNVVRYSPDGNAFVSGSADGKVLVYDGKTADLTGELGSPAHKAGVYAVCFNKDGSQLVSVSADKTAKIWDMASKDCVCTFTMGKAVEDMQVGCLWQGDTIITVSLSGFINYLDKENPDQPSRIIKGHNKPITSVATVGGEIFSAASDGKVCVWDAATGVNSMASGDNHTNQVTSMCVGDGAVVTCGHDDTIRFLDVASKTYSAGGVKMPSQPQCVATCSSGYTVVTTGGALVVLQGAGIVSTLPADYLPYCVAISPNQTTVAVGGKKDQSVHILELSGGTLTEVKVINVGQEVTAVQFSPDGAFLASGGSNKKVFLMDQDFKTLVSEQWVCHEAKITCLAWSPDSQMIATGGIDCNVVVWSAITKKFFKIHRAHQQSPVTGVSWLSDNILVSVGMDSNIRQWEITRL